MSSKGVSLPRLDQEELVKLAKASSIRPAVIATGQQIEGPIPIEAALVILMVAWPDLFSELPLGATPRQPRFRLLTSESGSARARPSGFGHARLGANYGPSFLLLGESRKKGCDQILWVLGPECQVTEAGASNFFVLIKNRNNGRVELIRSPLDDKIILDGITRQCASDLVRSRLSDDQDIVEAKFTMGDLQVAWKEATQFFISPVLVIGFEAQDMEVALKVSVPSGGCAEMVKGWLRDIMYGNEDHR
ncbi:hypothetical protein LB507_004228, partial [Fusarium sp. FIESC RH6]